MNLSIHLLYGQWLKFRMIIVQFIHLFCGQWLKFRMIIVHCFHKFMCFPLIFCYRHLLHRINKFFVQLLYFVSLSVFGFLILQSLKPRTEFRPRNLDLFFTSVSATTLSSMSTVEMEVFSNAQLVVMGILIFLGGEVFISMVGLHISSFKLRRSWKRHARIGSASCDVVSPATHSISVDNVELGIVTMPSSPSSETKSENLRQSFSFYGNQLLKIDSIQFLGVLVLGYLLLIQSLGVSSVLLYINLVPSAENVLKGKGLKKSTFAIFTTVATFSSCGFLPTNENMMVFRKNSLFLLILIPQVLLGNTLFPCCLRLSIWFLGKFSKKEESLQYLLQNTQEIGYFHLLPSQHSLFLAISVFGFIAIQFVLFCVLEWKSAALSGMNSFQRFAGVLFQTINSRHAGESIVDLSSIAPAMLVLFLIMMYLPPYTSFLPIKDDLGQNPQECEKKKKKKGGLVENLIFSRLTYIAMFIILICITERKGIKEDPLNFNVFNITVEVVSAYGNVGFSTGYSCRRQLNADPTCVDKWYGFAGKWSDEGKLILIVVMFFGRLKKFNLDGGKAWKLL